MFEFKDFTGLYMQKGVDYIFIKHYHLIIVTNTKGGRLALRSGTFNELVTIDYSLDMDKFKQAENYLCEKGFDIVGKAELPNSKMAIISTTLKSIKR